MSLDARIRRLLSENSELRQQLAGSDGDGGGLGARVERLEQDMREVRAALARLELASARIEATLPHLATKADLAEKPSKGYLWAVLAVLLTAYAAGLAGLAILK